MTVNILQLRSLIRWLTALLLAIGSISTAFAQVCCPAGCVQDGGQCVRTGPVRSICPRATCPATGNGNRSGSPGSGATYAAPILPPSRGPICTLIGSNKPPPGSYYKSCPSVDFRCSNDEDKLEALCKDKKGRIKKTQLPWASTCADIVNDNGNLVCRKHRRYVTQG